MKTNLLFVVGALLGVVACSSTKAASDGGTDGGGASGSFNCGQSNCPNDPPIAASVKKECEDSFSGSCGGLYGTAGECLKGKVKCGADGKTDVDSAIGASSACSKELADYEACAAPDGGG